ncbi:uncharacterized protein LOC134285262 [Aedes albopictus]|uniref:Uncharacterized protein n=1 Tax=Aedes albopictus TaxID=7160 RepID=A0ABM1ZA56_AEDAL
MSDSANAAATTGNQGKSLANQSEDAHVDPPNEPQTMNPNKDTLLKPGGDKKAPSVKSRSSKSREHNVPSPRDKQSETIGHSCQTCRFADHSRMVQCDDCDGWHHYNCVGVDDRIAKKQWRCVKCDDNRKVRRSSKTTRTEAPKKKATGKAKKESGTKQPDLQEQRKHLGDQPAKCIKAASVKSGTSRKSSRAQLELQLQKLDAERTLLEDKKKLIEQQYSVLQELAELDEQVEGAEDGDEVDGASKVEDWLRDGVNSDTDDESTDSSEGADEDIGSSSEEDIDDDPQENGSKFNPIRRSTPRMDPRSMQKSVTRSNQLNCSLNRNQLAARQVVAKDLPPFTGNPEEWPIFFSTYESTTRMCGYTNDENMIRLRNCLRGDAFAAVRSFLLHPSTVDRAISALKLRFGQPRFVIHSLRDKIIAMPPLKPDSINRMIDFALAVQNLEATIDACGQRDLMRDTSLLGELIGKLPASMKLEWARHTRSLRKVNLAAFSKWMYDMAEDACLVAEPRRNQEVQQSQEPRKKSKAFLNTHTDQPSWKKEDHQASSTSMSRSTGTHKKVYSQACTVCKGTCATLAKCGRFLGLSYDGRWSTIREARVCRKCLKQHKGGCESKQCGVSGCTYKHHPLLHKELNAETAAVVKPQREEQSCNTHQSGASPILFRYVPVIVYGCGIVVHCYAFLDDGSSKTLMDEELAKELNLSGERHPLCLKWTGGLHRSEDESRSVQIDISGLKGKRFRFEDVRTVTELQLPSQTLDVQQLQSEYYYLKGVPVESYRDVRPRLLIGVQHAHATLVRKSREGRPGQPIAIKTNLGWTIYGGAPAEQSVNMVHYTNHVSCCDHDTEKADENLGQVVKEYFSLESLGVTSPVKQIRSQEDERAMKQLRELTQFNGVRYESGLLWRRDSERLPNNKAMALKRFNHLERRMEKDSELARIVKEKLIEYVTKGYARKLTTEELAENHERVWYLPVFPVVNPNKPGKIRLVWDAAATTNGVSLNSALLTGPDLLEPLMHVLYRFRQNRFAICGDIREMFHQVAIRNEDQHSQRFFLSDEEGQPEPGTYVMQVMTFGASCSPTTAQFVKNTNAERFSKTHPAAVTAIVRCTYVDDMLTSTETEQEAIELAKSVWFVHKEGGFEIRNWMSNSPTVLAALHGDLNHEKSLDLSSTLATEKVLGMWWCTQTDCFTYKINWSRLGEDLLTGERYPTKREVLRTMMTIYDPLGLIAHYLMFLKVLLQDIWRTGITWDETVNRECFEKWQMWLGLLPEIEGLQIPRCYRLQTSAGENTEIELHTFVDAGENGMAAVAYLRFVEAGTVECSLVAAKTRVAPLKYLTIPRLELQAALIGARLAHFIVQGLDLTISRCVFWSDSRNALSWIRADHRRYSQFVAARVSEILDLTNVADWKWVPTKWNVADEGTKWQRRPSLTAESRWYKGPEFLWQREEEWPSVPVKLEETTEELRATIHVHYETAKSEFPIERFRDWRKLIRTTAHIFRFIANAQPKRFPRLTCGITKEEMRNAETFHFRAAQQECFQEVLAVLHRNDSKVAIPKRSTLYKLSPFIDGQGLLRMAGRTAACEYLSPDTINPIILPRDHRVTHLVVRSYHDKFHHQNHESVINEVRQKFCISRLRRVYAKIRSQCQRCKLRDARPRPPAMADLPPCRLAAFVRPFIHTGVDYFGPMEVCIGRRVEKRWGVLLTCLTIRAVHIELASSLTTNSCIMALRNFIARRGTPAVFYSDRGTNFIGSERELKQTLKAVDQNKMAQEFVSSTTSWSFNPPAAPHMGGSWERLVQSVKRTLSELKPSPRPNDEELRNALIEVEGILNARPLTHVPIEDEAAPALTPNHWLLGSSDGTKPWSLLENDSIALRRGWHQSQVLANHFWERWLREYLPEITRRSKWHKKATPIEEGDIVLIVDPELPRSCWPKGRVIGTVNRDGQKLVNSEAEFPNWGGLSPKPPGEDSTSSTITLQTD